MTTEGRDLDDEINAHQDGRLEPITAEASSSPNEIIDEIRYSKILERPIPRFPVLEPVSFSSDIQDAPGASDLGALQKLEVEIELITENLSQLLKYLQDRTFEVTEASSKCLDVLRSSLDGTCSAVDESIKMMYRLIAKCDEITRSLTIVDTYREEVRSLKKLLDLFENTLKLRSSQYVQLRVTRQH